MPPSLEDAALWPLLSGVLARTGVDWQQLLLSWARVLPLMLIVPAFGSRLMPALARAVFGIGLALVLLPALPPAAQGPGLWLWRFTREFGRGLPIALSTAALIWAAMMAGGISDDLRAAGQHSSAVLPDARTPLAAFFGLFAILAFLELGGVSSALAGLARPAAGSLLTRAVNDLVYAINIAFSLVAPLLCISVVWEMASALITRAASPAHVQAMLAPLRSVVLLGGLALVMRPLFELLVQLTAARVGQ